MVNTQNGSTQTPCNVIKHRINNRFMNLFVNNGEELKPYVCVVCDEFINGNRMERISSDLLVKNSHILRPENWNAVSLDIALCYQNFSGHDVDDIDEEAKNEIADMLLSPRATYIIATDLRTGNGYSCCQSCKQDLKNGIMPKYAIANNYSFGNPPPCLLALTEVELALLTPVKTYGYCFSFTGGTQKQLKGSLSYYKVKMDSIARTVMHFDALGLNNNIVVLLYGKMTMAQKGRAIERSKIRTNCVLEALDWLITYNQEWRNRCIDLAYIRNTLVNPVVIDNSLLVDGVESNTNIESSETFNVYFPDGTMSPVTGGQENLETFNHLVSCATACGYDIGIKTNLLKEAVSDFRDNNLVNACLLQFPYGRGGMHEIRMKANGSYTENTDIDEYLQHLSRISQPHFHEQLFCLIMYNLSMKQAMVRDAGWRVRNKCSAHALASEITLDELNKAINTKVNGRKRNRNENGHRLLDAVDAISRAVPHTNEAAKKARSDGECIQHHFGTPSLFLTVTPDDDNSILVQIMANEIIDNENPIQTLPDRVLIERAKERTNLRIKYPGICALNFEYVLEIIMEEVVGWDMTKGEPRNDNVGLFGKPKAFTVSVEEQGRRTLHAHIQIWIEEVNAWREGIYSSDRYVERSSCAKIVQYVDSISSCSMFFNKDDRPGWTNNMKMQSFPHQCIEIRESMKKSPKVVVDQTLRYLRQKVGSCPFGKMANCQHCAKSWTSDELVESYLLFGIGLPGLTKFPDNDARRLKAMAVEYQKNNQVDSILPCIINAGYNHHSHTKSCFESKSNVQDAVECRYRYPQRSQRKTIVQNCSDNKIPWFNWDGSKSERFLKEICLKRGTYDVFQNISCPTISLSKLSCNTNLTMVLPGPVGQYSFKYNLKGTQDDDTKEYGGVKTAMQKVLSKLRRYESDNSEAIRRVLSASFAHQKNNVVGSSMASYLTRNKSRFHFSHTMVWCPLRDLELLIQGEDATALVIQHGNTTFFQCIALHYLCRPEELEDLSVFQFFSKYEVVRATSQNRHNLMEFCNTPSFQHPSFSTKRQQFMQGVRRRKQDRLVKVYQYAFPDTASFKGSIFDNTVDINDDMELYSKMVLLLFLPFRTLADLCQAGSYTELLRQAVNDNIIGEEAKQYLQNMQDARSNSFRVKSTQDDLQRTTELHQFLNDSIVPVADDSVVDDIQGEYLDQLLEFLEDEDTNGFNVDDENELCPDDLPFNLSFHPIRNIGSLKCGYNCLARMKMSDIQERSTIMEIEAPQQFPTEDSNSAPPLDEEVVTIPTRHDIVSVLLSKTRRRNRTFEDITKSTDIVNVLEANGSVKSILDWARKAKLDRGQRRAFEVIISSFILTYYIDAEASPCTEIRNRHPFVEERKRLERLGEVRKRGSHQLICFLHGPGGSGKTTVIDLVMKYAEEYCNYFDNCKFDSRTIVVTAMTGVAASLLLGETAHSSIHLGKQKNGQPRQIHADQIEAWVSTRLLIIDEISFASKEDFIQINNNLMRLKQKLLSKYGDLSVVFSGDMRQMEPVGSAKKPIYEENCSEFKDFVNCYIELTGMHRFKNDMEWGHLLLRFRNGEVTQDDIKKINERVVKDGFLLPENIKYATYFNRDRDSINTALFEERCKALFRQNGELNDTLLVLCDNIQVRNSTKAFIPFRNRKTFWENCGEDSIKLGQYNGRMDPVLKLYTGCPLMLTRNKDVRMGEANGTQATLQKVVLKYGQRSKNVIINGNIPVQAVLASQVSHMLLRHENKRIQPSLFQVKPTKHSFKAHVLKPRLLHVKGKERETLEMKATQIQVVSNNATTGHKLQGTGVENLFVHNWSYVTNWVYVILSRVKTRSGLYCRKPLSTDLTKYAVPESLQKMIRHFSTKSVSYWSDDDYDEMFSM